MLENSTKNVDLKFISVCTELIIHTERFTLHIRHFIIYEKVKNLRGLEKNSTTMQRNLHSLVVVTF